MSTLDFIFNGSPPPSTTRYGQSVENVPQWMTDYTQGLVSRANAIAAQPAPIYQGPRIAPFNNNQTQAFSNIKNQVGQFMPTLQGGIDATKGALNSLPSDQASPYLTSSANFATMSANPSMGGLAQASPFINQAAKTFTDPNTVSSYMNPYVGNVIDYAGRLAGNAFRENILPQINDTFVRAGQFGSSGMQRQVGNSIDQIAQDLQGQSLAALSNAYQTGSNTFQSDQGRMGALASLVGNLGTQQQGATLQAAQQMGQLGATAGQLGSLTGQLQLGAGQQMGALASLGQQMGLQGNAALNAVGQEQQGQSQRNLDLAYQDWQNQTQYPQQMVDWLSQTIRGIPSQGQVVQGTRPADPNTLSSPLDTLLGSLSASQGMQQSPG